MNLRDRWLETITTCRQMSGQAVLLGGAVLLQDDTARTSRNSDQAKTMRRGSEAVAKGWNSPSALEGSITLDAELRTGNMTSRSGIEQARVTASDLVDLGCRRDAENPNTPSVGMTSFVPG